MKYVIQKEKMNPEEAKEWFRNILIFTSPALAIFFYQLSQGVPINQARLITILALYGILADFFKKRSEGK